MCLFVYLGVSRILGKSRMLSCASVLQSVFSLLDMHPNNGSNGLRDSSPEKKNGTTTRKRESH